MCWLWGAGVLDFSLSLTALEPLRLLTVSHCRSHEVHFCPTIDSKNFQADVFGGRQLEGQEALLNKNAPRSTRNGGIGPISQSHFQNQAKKIKKKKK